MHIYDGHGRLLRPTDDGVWVGSDFLYSPPMARELGLPGVVLVEPLRVQLAFGESVADGERAVARIRERYAGALRPLQARYVTRPIRSCRPSPMTITPSSKPTSPAYVASSQRRLAASGGPSVDTSS